LKKGTGRSLYIETSAKASQPAKSMASLGAEPAAESTAVVKRPSWVDEKLVAYLPEGGA
jgi:hypothetical protein